MPIAKGLLLKGLAGVTVCGGAAGGVIFREEIAYGIYGADTVTNGKLDTLSLPKSCYLHNKQSQKKCFLSQEELKKVKFKNKKENEDLTFEGNITNLELVIKVLKSQNEEDKKQYGNDITDKELRFTFKNFPENITIKGETGQDITLKTGTNPEFKINSNKLEKAWTADSLAKKAGLKECKSDNGKKCTIQTSGLKFSDDNGQTIKDLTPSTEDTDKITYEEDQEGYNQGFKFNVSEAITVTGTGTNNVNLPQGDYEIKYDKKVWYLSKKPTASAA